MKTLLVAINTKFIHTNLAIRYLRNVALEKGIPVEMAEYTINHRMEEILQGIYLQKPEILCFSCYLWNISLVRKLSVELKKVLPDLKIWCGGPEVTYHADTFLQENPAVDLVMQGEGEGIFPALLLALEQNRSFSEVKGITYRWKGEILATEPAPPFDLKDLPFAYHDLEQLSHKIVYFESSRGCPFSCSYCLSSVTRGVRKMPVELACQYLDRFIDRKVPQVKFVDRTFNCDKKHADAILRHLIEHDNGITNFHFEISADLLGDSTLELIRSARQGLFQFEVGVQSTNPQTLAAIHRSASTETVFAKADLVRQTNKAHVHEDLIAGLPLEDYDSFAHSYDEVFAHHPDMLQLGFLKVLKGSTMEADCEKYGIVYQSEPPYEVLRTNWLSFDEIIRLKHIDTLNDGYLNSGRFRRSLDYILRPEKFPSPFRFFEQLAQWFTDHNLWEGSAGKFDYYLWLYDFYKAHFGEEETLLWIFRHDILARENIRTFPEIFGQSLYPAYKNEIDRFFATPECIETYLPAFQGESPQRIARAARLEVFPFSPLTGEEVPTAILYDYSRRDFNGNAWHWDVSEVCFAK